MSDINELSEIGGKGLMEEKRIIIEKSRRYSIWLMPIGDVYNRLIKVISRLSKRYSSPNFEPHATLIGELIESEEDILSKTSQLSAVLRPFKIRLARVEYLDEYFRSLFIRVEETSDVIDANKKAREIFNRQSDPTYMPHLSLIYGIFTSKEKGKIIAEIGKEFNTNFEVESIHLFSTDGKPKDWYRVKEFTLK